MYMKKKIKFLNLNRRKQIVATMEDCDAKEQKVRPPFVVILQNCMKPCIEGKILGFFFFF